MSQQVKTVRVWFWRSEPFYSSPATREKKIVNLSSMVAARLTWNIDFKGLTYQGLKLNEERISTKLSGTEDITGLIVEGVNQAKIDFSTLLGNIGYVSGIASVYIDIDYPAGQVLPPPSTVTDAPPIIDTQQVTKWLPVAILVGVIIIVAAVGVSLYRKGMKALHL